MRVYACMRVLGHSFSQSVSLPILLLLLLLLYTTITATTEKKHQPLKGELLEAGSLQSDTDFPSRRRWWEFLFAMVFNLLSFVCVSGV